VSSPHSPKTEKRIEMIHSLWGFVGACAPDSPMRMVANGLAQDLKVQHAGPGGYIGLDHAKTMDLCKHPEWQEFHGTVQLDTIENVLFEDLSELSC
jgi:hypothetical protein